MTDEIIEILDLWWWPYVGNPFWNPIIQYEKAIKGQQCFRIAWTAPQARTIPTIPTFKEEPEIFVLFSVLIIIIIILEYISMIY